MPAAVAGSRDTVLSILGVVDHALYAPGGIVDSLSPDRLARFHQGHVYVDSFPTAEERASVGAPAPDFLFGRYVDLSPLEDNTGPWTIQLYADEITRGGRDPVDVLVHELGHVWGYDHGDHCPECATLHRQQRQHVHNDACPVCNLHNETAIAMGLLDGLRTRAYLEHVIPLGLGGTIPEARLHLGRAQNLLGPARSAGGDAQLLAVAEQRLADAQESLAGWLDVERVTRAYAAARLAWDACYDQAHSFFTPTSRVTA